MRANRVIIGVAGLLASLAAAPAHASPCAEHVEAARAVRHDPQPLEKIFAKAERDCPQAEAVAIGQTLGVALFNRAQRASGAAQLSDLRRAAEVTRDWRVMAALGQVESQNGNHEQAARSFQLALLELQENPPDPLPPQAVTKRLITMANNARAASPVYVRSITTRSGEPGGETAESVAGVEIEVVPFPVEFVFGKTDLTPSGAFAVDDLARLLADSEASSVVLAGHTDPIGSDAYNMELSIARAEAVRQALLEKGISARIEITGCGEAHPPEIEAPDLYSLEETHEIMRRVELVRNGSPCR